MKDFINALLGTSYTQAGYLTVHWKINCNIHASTVEKTDRVENTSISMKKST